MTRTIAFADEFNYEIDGDSMVHIVVDGENTIRVSIPFDILRELSEQVCQIPN